MVIIVRSEANKNVTAAAVRTAEPENCQCQQRYLCQLESQSTAVCDNLLVLFKIKLVHFRLFIGQLSIGYGLKNQIGAYICIQKLRMSSLPVYLYTYHLQYTECDR